MARYRVRNVEKYQHYKHRNPDWIKWYGRCLEDPEFMALKPATRWLAVVCVVLSSRSEDGEFTREQLEFMDRRRIDDAELGSLVNAGFLSSASNVLATCLQPASDMLAQSRVEESREEILCAQPTAPPGFLRWWKSLKGRVQESGRRHYGSRSLSLAQWKSKKLEAVADEVIRGTAVYQETVDSPKDGERILKHDIWRDFLEADEHGSVKTLIDPDSPEAQELRRRYGNAQS